MTKASQPARKRGPWLGAAAAAALVAGGAVGGGYLAPTSPARAELRSLSQPIAMPSFADVIDRVKPAVVSVRVKVQNVAARSDNDGDGQQFSMPNLPEGHPLERFFREFRDQQQQPGRGNPRQAPRRFGKSQGSGF